MKKLLLNKESVRVLVSSELELVAGGHKESSALPNGGKVSSVLGPAHGGGKVSSVLGPQTGVVRPTATATPVRNGGGFAKPTATATPHGGGFAKPTATALIGGSKG
jgi:hypothetical protein